MAVARLRFLDRAEEDLVHAMSLRILAEVGVLVRSPAVARLLARAGADVDARTGLARIPESMVRDALAKAPKHFRLCGREPSRDIEVPVADGPRISTDGLSVYMTDLDTGEKRPTTRKDLADFARLADALDAVGFFWPQVTASEVPQAAHSVHEMWTSLQHTTKHVQGDSTSPEDAKAQIAVGALVAGGDEDLRKRPVLSVTVCPIAPLSFERGAVEGQVEFARAGVPVSSMSMSLSGVSAPVTLAGTIANANAENLASLVITQAASPGAPHIYSSESTPMDPALGTIHYAAPEVPMLAAGLVQMARRYGLPCMVGQWGVNGDKPGMPVSFSELFSIAATTLAGSDLCSGMGGLEDAKGGSLEQMVLDASLWEHTRQLLRTFRVDEAAIALDVLREVGPGHTFLRHPHTRTHFREELAFRDPARLAWEATRSTDMVAEARAIVRRILAEHEVPPLDRDVRKQGDRLLADFEATVKA